MGVHVSKGESRKRLDESKECLRCRLQKKQITNNQHLNDHYRVQLNTSLTIDDAFRCSTKRLLV